MVDAFDREDIDDRIHNVLIIDGYIHNNGNDILQRYMVNEMDYELRIVMMTWRNNNKWDGKVYSRHGNYMS